MSQHEVLTLFDDDRPATDASALRLALTAEQRTAVERRRGSLLLSASAGSGKTSVLVERLVAAIVEDGLEPRQILAITFTDRAAGEMRERLRGRLLDIGARDAARDAEGALVLTIHGFCSRLLRTSPLTAGLDPAFSVLDEHTADRLRRDAFSDAVSRFLDRSQPALALDLVAAFGMDRLEAVVLGLYAQLRSGGQRRPVLPAIPEPPAAGDARSELAGARRELACELGELAGPDTPVRVAAALDALERCRELLEQPAAQDLADPGRLSSLVLASGNTGSLRTQAAARYSAALAAYRALCADHAAARSLAVLGDLLDLHGAAYEQRKRSRSALDFDDLEIDARDLLASDDALCQQWADRFALVMVDEFQDTNPRQLEILGLIERDNLFTVGDEFQSIYGFRHADVRIFQGRREAMTQQRAAIRLTTNFRSVAPVIDAVNRVFATRFGPHFAELRPGRTDNPAPGHTGASVELLVTDAAGWDAAGNGHGDQVIDRGDSLPPGAAWRHAEARLLAQRIDQLISGGSAQAGDVAVLVRATGDLLIYQRALEERGLPTLAAGAGGYWSRQQVRDLIAYLAVLANPLDNRALYSVLASPLVGLSSDALALIALAPGAASDAWTVLGGAAPPESTPDDAARLERFRQRIRAERALMGHLPLETLLERALTQTGYDLHVLSLRGGERRLANIHKLMRMARVYEAAEGRDLRGFVDHAGAHERAQSRDPDAPVQDPELDAVRLMSIHAAKGLEFPVVCLADLGRQGRTETDPVLVGDGRVAARLPTLDGSPTVSALGYADLRERRLAAEAQEEARVMYVGMTRAREHLILSGSVDVARWPADRHGACPLSWLGPALVPGLAEALDPDDPDRVIAPGQAGAGVRLVLNSPATRGRILGGSALPADGESDSLPAPQGASESDMSGGLHPLPEPAQAPDSREVAVPVLSYTALSEYSQCGYRFYVQRVLGLPDEPIAAGRGWTSGLARPPIPGEASQLGERQPDPHGVPGDARRRGIIVHALLEDMDLETPRPADLSGVRAVAARVGETVTDQEALDCAALAAAFARSPLCGRLARARDVRREHSFSVEVGSQRPLLTGVIDVLGYEQTGVLLVVDFKTDTIHGMSLDAHVEAHYALQRSIYALAGLRSGAQEVEVAHCFLRQPEALVTRRVRAVEVGHLEVELARAVDEARSGRFPVAAEPHRDLCLTCPARRRLCSWGEAMTLRPGR